MSEIIPIDEVLACWKRVQTGELPYREQEVYGNLVKAYDAGFCGFYLS